MTNPTTAPPNVFLTAEWRYLLMLNFEIDRETLRPHVPRGTELDLWQDRAMVSLVGFWFRETRVYGWAVPFHTDFEEVNLRFYVRREAPEGVRRGVVFIKELVPRRAVAAVARVFYNEQYSALPMRHRINYSQQDPMRAPLVEYAWRVRGQWDSMSAVCAGYPQEIAPGSEEEFITEHYWGYSSQRNGDTMEYHVEHPRWLIWPTSTHTLECNAAAMYGEAFGKTLSAPACSAFVAYGSPVTVHRGQRLHAAQ